jgi:hypothetical protein
MDPAGTAYKYLAGPDFPRDLFVIDTHSQLLNETWQKAIAEDGLYNHHLPFIDMSTKNEPWLACNGTPVRGIPGVASFMAVGSEDIDAHWSSDSKLIKAGYYLDKNDTITINLDVVNYYNRERTIYTVSEMEYFPGMTKGFLNTQSDVLPVGMCDGIDSYLAATKIHAPKDQKKFTLSGKNDIVIHKEGYITSICRLTLKYYYKKS